MFEKSFLQPARRNLRYILSSFSCRSPLRRPHAGKISCELLIPTRKIKERRKKMFLIIVSIILFIYAAIVFATGKNIFGNNNKYIKEEFYALYNKCSAVDLMLYIVLIDIWYFTNCSYWILIFSVVAVTLVIYIHCRKKGVFR